MFEEFIQQAVKVVRKVFGDDPASSPRFGRLIPRQFGRVQKIMERTNGDVVIGGQMDSKTGYVAPTIVRVSEDDILLESEIFGPVLAVLPIASRADAIRYIQARPSPLGLYIYSRDIDAVEEMIRSTRSGSVCVNDAMSQLIPCGSFLAGVGESGLGGGYGYEKGFRTFSHERIVMYSTPATATALHTGIPPHKIAKS